MTTVTPLTAPRVDFSTVAHRVNRMWDPFERNPHHVVFGTTGSGKSYLIRYGILPIREDARTLILDLKGGRDPLWSGYGQPVTQLPAGFAHAGDGPARMRYRLIVDRADAKRQVRRALDQVLSEGHCVVVIDESKTISQVGGLALGAQLEALINEGRGLGVTVVLGAQSAAWAMPAVKDQAGALWIGRQRNAKAARELADIAGYGRELDPVIRAGIPPRQWLYVDAWDAEPLLAITGLTGLSSPT